MNNGRVDTLNGDNFAMYSLYQEKRPSETAHFEAIKSIHVRNELSDIFFSRMNIDYIQEAIRYLVFEKSCGKHVIDKQSETELIIVMRSIYLQYGQNRLSKLNDHVRDLNTQVLNFCVPKIIQEINIYLRYRKDISALPVPMDRGEFVSSKGTKVLQQSF